MNDEIDKAIRALKNADAAGDFEAARKIAAALKGVEIPSAREKVSHTGGLAGQAVDGLLAGFGEEYLAGLSAALGVQPDGEGGANWFDYAKPTGERYSTALEAIRSERAGYQEENPWKAGAAKVGGAIAGAVGTAAALPVKAAATTAGRVGQMAAGGAVGGGIEGFGSGEGGFENRAKGAAIGAGVGAVFAPVVGFGMSKIANQAQKIGGAALRRVFTNRQMFNRETGELTNRGRQSLERLGYNADELSTQMQRAFGQSLEKATSGLDDGAQGAAVGRMAAADRFGVPLTRGQATGEVSQVASEESMRAGVRGTTAERTMKGFDNVQGNIIEEARDNIGGGFGASQGRIDAADSVITGVKREAEAARKAGSAAYHALDESGAAIEGRAFPGLKKRIESAVFAEGYVIDEYTPNARAAMTVLQRAFDGSEKGAVPFANIERARQNLVSLRRAAMSGSNGADQVATSNALQQFDGWLDDTITDALISGDQAVLGQAKNARKLWSKYRQTFLSREGADNFVRKIVEDDLAPDQVAGWLFGGSRNIGGGQTSLVAKRVKNILGETSEEWGAVKRAAWDHITKQTEGRDAFGPQQISSNISELLSGKGQSLGREMFSDQELRLMGEFRDMLKVLVPPKKATNPSGSGYQVERGAQLMLQGMASLIGGSAGGPVGAAATAGAVSAGSNFSGTLAARAAARGVTFKPASVSVAIGAGVGTGSVAVDAVSGDRKPMRIDIPNQ